MYFLSSLEIFYYVSNTVIHQLGQAVDRCYRIGQTKNVVVYRFITSGTVEGMLRLGYFLIRSLYLKYGW